MAEFFPPVIFEVKAKATEAIAEFSKVNAELKMMEKNGVVASAGLARVERASKLAGTALFGLAGIFGVVAATSLHALDGFEKSQVTLETAIKNTGVSFKAAEPAIQVHADSMKNLGFTYGETYDALAKMTAASGSPQLALNSLSAAADLARFKGISLADAGSLVARASIGQARGLGELGIALGKTLPKGASFEQILKAIEDRTGGLSKAFGETLAGKLAIAKANFNALEIQIGTQLVPTAIKLTDWVSKTAIPALKEFGDWFSKHIGIIKTFGIVLGAIWATGKIVAFVTMIGKVITAMRALATSAAVAAAAEALATGGANLLLGGAAIAAAVVGGFKLKDLISGKTTGTGATPYDPTSGTVLPYTSLAGTRRPTLAQTGATLSKASLKEKMRGQTMTINVKSQYNPHPSTVSAIAGNSR